MSTQTKPTHYEPKGIKFYSQSRKQDMLFCTEEGHPFYQWICYKHPDGQWVTLRKSTEQDHVDLGWAMDAARKAQPTPVRTQVLEWFPSSVARGWPEETLVLIKWEIRSDHKTLTQQKVEKTRPSLLDCFDDAIFAKLEG